MKTLLALVGAVCLLLLSPAAKAAVNAQCDVAPPLGTLSSGHTSGITIPGAMVDISCYPDNSYCVGDLQISTTASVPALLTLINDATSNYTLTIPCGSDAAAAIPNYECATNGSVARDPTLDTCKTAAKTGITTCTYKPWSVRTSVMWDTASDTAVIKYVDVSNLTSIYNLCGMPVWYVMSASSASPFCETSADCVAMMAPIAGEPAVCNTAANSCYYDPPVSPIVVPWACGGLNGNNFGTVIPCMTDQDCVPYAQASDAYWNALIGASNSYRTFCVTADFLIDTGNNGQCDGQGENTCAATPCPPGSTQPECAPFEPSGSCTSTCLGN